MVPWAQPRPYAVYDIAKKKPRPRPAEPPLGVGSAWEQFESRMRAGEMMIQLDGASHGSVPRARTGDQGCIVQLLAGRIPAGRRLSLCTVHEGMQCRAE